MTHDDDRPKPRQFRDLAGRLWTLTITVATIKRVREATGVHLSALFDNRCKLLGELAGNIEQMVDVLYSALQPQIEKLQLTPTEFADGLGGDVLSIAFSELTEAVIDFFPQSRVRKSLRGIMARAVEVREAAFQAFDELDEIVRNVPLPGASSARSGSSPDSSACTPTTSPCDNSS